MLVKRSEWSIPESVRAALDLFHERAIELTTLGNYPVPFAASISLMAGKLETSAVVPNEDVLRSAAMAVRLFVQQKEPTHIPRTCNLLSKCATTDRQRADVAEIRRNFLENMKLECSIQYGTLRTHEEVLDTILNGAYLHSDAALRPIAKELAAGPGLLARQQFALVLIEIRGTVEALLALVQEALGVEDRHVPGLEQIRVLLLARGKSDVGLEIEEFDQPSANGPESVVLVHVGCHLSAKEADELHFECSVVLRDTYPSRKWYALEWQDDQGRWHAPAISPYPRFP